MSSISKYKEGIIWPIIGICISFIGIPIFFDKIPIITTILFLYIIWMVISKKSGYTLILISISLCIPGGIDSDINKIISSQLQYLFLIERVSIFLIFIYQLKIKKKKIPFANTLLYGIITIVIGIFYSLLNDNAQEYIWFINNIIFINFFLQSVIGII